MKRTSRVTAAVLTTLLILGAAPSGQPEVTKGTGYCVMPTVEGEPLVMPDGRALRIDVPLHTPNVANLEELRQSLFNALFRAADHAATSARFEADPEKRTKLERQAGRVMRKLAHGVWFAWEPEFIAKPKCEDCGGSICKCATYLGSDVVPGAACGGACYNCWLCY